MKVKVVNVFLKAVFELAAFKFLSKMLIESKLKSLHTLLVCWVKKMETKMFYLRYLHLALG